MPTCTVVKVQAVINGWQHYEIKGKKKTAKIYNKNAFYFRD